MKKTVDYIDLCRYDKELKRGIARWDKKYDGAEKGDANE